jgi:hypothetical protein
MGTLLSLGPEMGLRESRKGLMSIESNRHDFFAEEKGQFTPRLFS